MNTKFYGDVCAHFPSRTEGGKAYYTKIGSVFKSDEGYFSIKLDTFPLPTSNWGGWLNIFERKGEAAPGVQRTPHKYRPPDDDDDDIPF